MRPGEFLFPSNPFWQQSENLLKDDRGNWCTGIVTDRPANRCDVAQKRCARLDALAKPRLNGPLNAVWMCAAMLNDRSNPISESSGCRDRIGQAAEFEMRMCIDQSTDQCHWAQFDGL